MHSRLITLLFVLLVVAACGGDDEPEVQAPAETGPFPPVTVSGISSGGYMAGQFQVAYSADVSGAAIVAAGPWACAQGSLQRALGECISGQGIDTSALRQRATDMAAAGAIDSIDNLESQRLFFFRGSLDAVIPAPLVDAARALLVTDANEAQSMSVADIEAAHAWVTDDFGAACDAFESPYINNCDYDLAGSILAHLYGELAPPAETTAALTPVDQSAFADASLADTGYAYIPQSCSNENCRVHVFFHGCEQSAETIGTVLAAQSGFNEWAETNRLIVFYPQVAPSRITPMNPLGCWDWWGYTGEDYLEKGGAQLSAVRALIERIAAMSSS